MSKGLKAAAGQVRKAGEKAARRVSPVPERFKVLRKSPLLLEAYGSDCKLSEEDDDVEIARGLRKLVSKGDDAFVITDKDGDHVVITVTGPGPDPEG